MDYTAGVVAIVDSDDNIVGTGFVVSERERLVATCAHVVMAARKREDNLFIRFRADNLAPKDRQRPATVLNEWWLAEDAGDIAFLQFDGGLPEGVLALLLGDSAGTTGHEVRTFGYPAIDKVDGLPALGKVAGPTEENGRPLLALEAGAITAGFSGAPAWDVLRRCVIGMVVKVAKSDRFGKLADTAFITPTKCLQKLCPVLTLSDVCPYLSLDAFTKKEAEFFFGRDKVIKGLLDSLRQEPRFLAVLGPSGSDKSSVVQAGLLPQLAKGRFPAANAGYRSWSGPQTNPWSDWKPRDWWGHRATWSKPRVPGSPPAPTAHASSSYSTSSRNFSLPVRNHCARRSRLCWQTCSTVTCPSPSFFPCAMISTAALSSRQGPWSPGLNVGLSISRRHWTAAT